MTQYQQAIRDDDEVIRLKPDDAEAYSERGLIYILSGNKLEGLRSHLVHASLNTARITTFQGKKVTANKCFAWG